MYFHYMDYMYMSGVEHHDLFVWLTIDSRGEGLETGSRELFHMERPR